MKIIVEKIEYRGWPNCYRIGNGQVEAVVTTDVGPRIIRCGGVNQPNLFAEFPEQIGQTGGEKWLSYGGHRLWHSPELSTRTYFPDNQPVGVEVLPDGIHLRPPVETTTGIQKELRITMDGQNDRSFLVEHRLTNIGSWAVTLAPWAITVMKTGGTAIVPHYRENVGEGLLPNRVLSLWPYTQMDDSRVQWGARYTRVRQNPNIEAAFKFGLFVPAGWLAYHTDNSLFVKLFPCQAGAVYPDGGVNGEIYTNHQFLEVESLGAMQTLEPGSTAIHCEKWVIFEGVPEFVDEANIFDFFTKNVCNLQKNLI